jgi:hypothetical protein
LSVTEIIVISLDFGLSAFLLARSSPMLDVILISLGLGFFVAAVGYALLCDRL